MEHMHGSVPSSLGQAPTPQFKRVSILCALASVAIALAGLLGYLAGIKTQGNISTSILPMAPSTAVSLIVLGSIVAFMSQKWYLRQQLIFKTIPAGLALVYALLVVLESIFGRSLTKAVALFSHTEYLGEDPIGKMGPVSGVVIIATAMAILALSLRNDRSPRTLGRLRNWASLLGWLVLVVSLVFCISQVVDPQLVLGSDSKSIVSLHTALGFLMLAVGIIGNAGPQVLSFGGISELSGSSQTQGARAGFFYLTLVMAAACGVVLVVVIMTLYQHNIKEHREMLQVTARSQARLIESMARYEAQIGESLQGIQTDIDLSETTIRQIIDAHEHYSGFGATGELTLARHEGQMIEFILRHRKSEVLRPAPIPYESKLAEPMRRALKGISGTVIGLDYRGEMVLAAFEPIDILDLGIVAKMDLSEVRAPFVRYGLVAAFIALLVTFTGTLVFARISHPIIRGLENQAKELENEIDERERAQEEMRQYELIVSNSSDMLALVDKNFIYLAANATYLKAFNKTKDEVIGSSVADIFGDDIFINTVQPNGLRCLAGEEVSFRNWLKFTDQGTWYMDITYSPYLDTQSQVQGFVVTARDHTQRIELEEQTQQLQRVESIGTLAGGVAHDLNNLLTPILGYSEILVDDLDDDDSRKESAEKIMEAGVRARNLVQQLLAFSRKQTLKYETTDLNSVIANFEDLLLRTIPEDITIEIRPSPHVNTILADVGQLEQVIMNLAVNAADSMPKGGKLLIETDLVSLDDEAVAASSGVAPGLYVMMAFTDTGIGMDTNSIKHIFDPFYSTKGSKGTGLGLSTVYGIVKQHGGNIWAASEQGKGSSFKVYLPVPKETPDAEEPTTDISGKLSGSETILLVEDSEEVLWLAKKILTRYGYNILDAQDGKSALTTLTKNAGKVDLLLTDVIMPEMNGRTLHREAVAIQADLSVLYMSGYTDDVIASRGILDKGINFIQKPFTSLDLATKVRNVLDMED